MRGRRARRDDGGWSHRAVHVAVPWNGRTSSRFAGRVPSALEERVGTSLLELRGGRVCARSRRRSAQMPLLQGVCAAVTRRRRADARGAARSGGAPAVRDGAPGWRLRVAGGHLSIPAAHVGADARQGEQRRRASCHHAPGPSLGEVYGLRSPGGPQASDLALRRRFTSAQSRSNWTPRRTPRRRTRKQKTAISRAMRGERRDSNPRPPGPQPARLSRSRA